MSTTKSTASLLVLLTLIFGAAPARAETVNCTPITALPAVITVQGIYCFTGNLATAIDATKSSGVFGGWLDAAVPRLGADPSKVTADTLLGRDPAMRYRLGADGSYRHIVDDSTSTMWTRDSAFMTPQGLVICNAASRRRARENMLLRFAYAYSPLLKPFPIAFDAVECRCSLWR